MEGDETFAPLATPSQLSTCATDRAFLNVQYWDRMIEWVLFGFLACPTYAASDPSAQELLRVALSDGYVVPLFREQFVYIHALYAEAMKGAASKSFDAKSFVRTCEETAVGQAGLQHRQRRTMLRRRAADLITLFNLCPGLLAPKFPMVLSLLSIGRHEVEWFMRHNGVAPRPSGSWMSRTSAAKLYNSANFEDVTVVELIGVLCELTRVVESGAPGIRAYYARYLGNAHVKAQRRNLEAVSGSPWLTSRLRSILDSMVDAASTAGSPDGGWDEDYRDQSADSGALSSLHAMRVSWLRGLAVLWGPSGATRELSSGMGAAGPMGGGGMKMMSGDLRGSSADPPPVQLLARARLMCTHSRYVDDLGGLLREFASMRVLWWYQFKFSTLFSSAVEGEGEISPMFAPASLLAVPHGLSNFSAPETGGDDAVARVRKLTQALCDCVEAHVAVLVRFTLKVHQLGLPLSSWQRELQDASGDFDADGVPLGADVAGDVAATRRAERCLVALLQGCKRVQCVEVFDHRFDLPSMLSARICEYASQLLASIGAGESQSRLRPTGAEVEFDALIHVLTTVDSFGEVMRDRAFHAVLKQIGTSSASMTHADAVAAWLTSFVTTTIAPGRVSGIVYAVALEEYVSDKRTKHSAPFVAETHLSRGEIAALGRTLGNAGVAVVENALLAVVAEQALAVHEWLRTNQEQLEAFPTGCHDRETWRAISKAVGAGSDIATALITIGHAMTLRSLLLRAAREAMGVYAPAAAAVVSEAAAQMERRDTSVLPDPTHVTELKRLVNSGGFAVGVDRFSTVKDARLLKVLGTTCISTADAEVWQHLPAAMALVLQSPVWSGASYLNDLGGFHNNAHVVMPAINHLLVAYASLCAHAGKTKVCATDYVASSGVTDARGGAGAADVARRGASLEGSGLSPPAADVREAWVREFVMCAATQLLRMLNCDRDRLKAYPVLPQMLLLERFVDDSPFVTRSSLERWLPYTLLSAAAVEAACAAEKKRGVEALYAASDKALLTDGGSAGGSTAGGAGGAAGDDDGD